MLCGSKGEGSFLPLPPPLGFSPHSRGASLNEEHWPARSNADTYSRGQTPEVLAVPNSN